MRRVWYSFVKYIKVTMRIKCDICNNVTSICCSCTLQKIKNKLEKIVTENKMVDFYK